MHIIFGLYGFRVIMIPIIIMPFKQTQRQINIVDDMLDLSYYLLINLILYSDLLFLY